jgi:hypothetical protein
MIAEIRKINTEFTMKGIKKLKFLAKKTISLHYLHALHGEVDFSVFCGE